MAVFLDTPSTALANSDKSIHNPPPYLVRIISSRFLYPGLVALVVATVSFPLGTGQFMAGELTTHEQVSSLFSDFSWTGANLTVEQQNEIRHWITPHTGVHLSLACYTAFTVSVAED